MKADAILDKARNLPQAELRELVLRLTDALDDESNVELASVLTSRRRAAEMKNGTASGLSHEEAFSRARKAFAG